MNNPIPLEYLTSSQTSQAMMQQLATGLLTSGDNATDFTRYSELALVQQNYLQQMGAVDERRHWFRPGAAGQGRSAVRKRGVEEKPVSRVSQAVVLVNARYVNDLIERASLDDRTRKNASSHGRSWMR